MIKETLVGLGRRTLKVLLLLAAVEAAVLAAVEAFETVRRKFWKRAPKEGFPWEEQPEIELDGGDRIKLYPDYGRLYEDMLAEIERAEQHIFVETFMWLDDKVGTRFVDALASKAREGVKVYAIFDELANLSEPSSFKNFPEEIHTLRFRSFSGPAGVPLGALNPRNLHRNHRKILSVDGRVAFAGGFNIGELFIRWRGTHFRIRGDQVHELERTFVGFWNTHRPEWLPEVQLPEGRCWDPALVIHSNDPYHHTHPIRDLYLRNLDKAQERVLITSAYFVPGVALRERMIDAARRGVEVQVLFPKYSNHAFVDWLSRQHLGELLKAGVRVFVYENFMIHAKTATVDGVWSTIGSANLDNLSLFGLHETNLEIYSDQVAQRLEAMFDLDKTIAQELTLESWESRPLPVKLIEAALKPLRIAG
ncbi:MAG: phosphatidylserine/phosphatidylglycerophosphate/cardiolipin synthase family protein [Rubrobacteraceae bacterium]